MGEHERRNYWEFKGEDGGSNYIYTISSKYTLHAITLVFTLIFGFVALASTTYFNPLARKGSERRTRA